MKKILIIEDTSDIRDLIGACLTASGFQTVAAEDGVQGVELARRHLPDLIISDINMPRLDGYGTLAMLRQDAATAHIPFIFLTGVTDKIHVRQGMELGADDYLTKPFALHELISAVNARLKKQTELVKRSEQKLSELRGSITMALPHELLTPLNGIIGFASILMQDSASVKPQEVQEFAQHIYASATRLHRLIENFLIYSHLEVVASDPAKLEALRQADRLHVRELVSQVAQQEAHAAQRDRDLVLAVHEAALLISSEHLKKIAEEIVDNAFKFSEPGTSVRVTVAQRENVTSLAVANYGRGMTPEQIASIGAHMQFERKFYEQQGSGLGLTIAKRLTELHGGRLTIDSTPGQETVVEAAFPRLDVAAASAKAG
ncbi:MAG: hybrid sensor histidine kinase/response regulator [Verrucomicrobia bacterium]|nr:hybrid sensor histidine kinase/response regulator [Verrucomicrobiota bacterium]